MLVQKNPQKIISAIVVGGMKHGSWADKAGGPGQ
jgi:hypothetical protein